jgi:hypothetical protein
VDWLKYGLGICLGLVLAGRVEAQVQSLGKYHWYTHADVAQAAARESGKWLLLCQEPEDCAGCEVPFAAFAEKHDANGFYDTIANRINRRYILCVPGQTDSSWWRAAGITDFPALAVVEPHTGQVIYAASDRTLNASTDLFDGRDSLMEASAGVVVIREKLDREGTLTKAEALCFLANASGGARFNWKGDLLRRETRYPFLRYDSVRLVRCEAIAFGKYKAQDEPHAEVMRYLFNQEMHTYEWCKAGFRSRERKDYYLQETVTDSLQETEEHYSCPVDSMMNALRYGVRFYQNLPKYVYDEYDELEEVTISCPMPIYYPTSLLGWIGGKLYDLRKRNIHPEICNELEDALIRISAPVAFMWGPRYISDLYTQPQLSSTQRAAADAYCDLFPQRKKAFYRSVSQLLYAARKELYNAGDIPDNSSFGPETIQSVEEVLQYNADNVATALNSYAWYSYQHGRADTEAARLLKWSAASLQAQPDNPAFLDTYAHLLYKQGKRKQAIRTQRKAVALAVANTGSDADLRNRLQKALEHMENGRL